MVTTLLRTLCLSFTFRTLLAATGGGSDLWVRHVTASKRVSIWTNKAQLEREMMQPQLAETLTHPWALQTRWDLTKNVRGAPEDLLFVMIEMGSLPFCGTDSCSDTIVLFGLRTVANGDTQLYSYKSAQIGKLVQALHKNASADDTLINYDDMHADNVTVLYKYYPGNASFYGVGGGAVVGGGSIEVRELVAHNLVAPLEIFIDAQGHHITEYDTPLEYHHEDTATVEKHFKSSRFYKDEFSNPKSDPPAWPPQIAPAMPTMFTAHVRGFEDNLTEYGIWHYDWPRNRLRNDFVVTEGNQIFNMTQLWLANDKKFYVFQGGVCSYFELDLGMLRPDNFEHAMMVDPYSKDNPSGARYVGREMQDGRWSDHFVYGPPGDNQFNIWHDIETNLPVYDYGPTGNGLGGNHWSNWTIGRVPESAFDLDTSQCNKSEHAQMLMRIPSLFVSHNKF